MKTFARLSLAALLAGPVTWGQASDYTNFIRQTILDTNPPLYWDVSVPKTGERASLVPVDLAGSRYELWTVKTGSSPTSYLLDTTYVSAFAPAATIQITTEDTDWTGPVPRTRADRPFWVDVEVSGLLNGIYDPPESKSVRLLRHVQSYGNGNGENIDRSQAQLYSQAVIDRNGSTELAYDMTSIPGNDRTKIRGEERFSVFTRKNNGSNDQQLVSRYLQIWPLASARISGIESGEVLRFEVPSITVRVNDLYPTSYTYTQIYPGPPKLGTKGKLVQSAQLAIDQATPESREWTAERYDELLEEDGEYTIEVVTETVFGTERLAYVSFDVDRALEVNSMISTSDGS